MCVSLYGGRRETGYCCVSLNGRHTLKLHLRTTRTQILLREFTTEEMGQILIYSPRAGTALGHPFMYAARVCECEVGRGQDVYLVTTPGFRAKYYQVYGRDPAFPVLERTKCDFSKIQAPSGFLGKLRYGWYRVTYGFRMVHELKIILTTGRFSVLHWLDNPDIVSTLWFAVTTRRLCSRLGSTAWFINVHPGDLSFRSHRRDPLRAIYKAASAWGLKFLIRRSMVSGIFVHGEWIRDRLLAALNLGEANRKIFVAPYGTDVPGDVPRLDRAVARQVLELPEDAYIALHFGTIRKDKGLDDIIGAVSLVEGIVLVIAGMPMNVSQEEIVQWLDEAGVADRTILRLEYIPERDVGNYFAAADVVVFAHKKGFAGQSGPLHLACTYLVPVIASDVGDVGRFVRENGIGELFPSADQEALGNVLLRFQRMAGAIYERYRERERETSVKMSWEAMVGCYLRAYKDEV